MVKTPTKQALLHSLAQKIRKLQDGYDTIFNLPDDVFGEIEHVLPKQHNDSEITSLKFDEKSEEHGWIRNAVLNMILKANKPIRKLEIIEEINKLYPQLKGKRSVTYAITGLQQKKEIKPYKPNGIKVRGNFYTAIEWWDGETLKKEYTIKR